ncbi:MAG: ATPase [Peptoniphilaceae bacterium]|nr:ATPase [Peptoniphilaceae bacterium]MDY6085580.1 ATPase [Peptoniphilaceae bacterium]
MDILQLIEELEDVMEDASSIPLSKKVAIDPDEVFEILREIRASLPEEIRQAKWVNDERDRILQEANEQAQQLTDQAQKRVEDSDKEMQQRFQDLVNDHRITQEAQKRGEQMIASAQEQSRQIRQSVFAYVDEILANTQDNLQSVIQELSHNRDELK